MFGLGLHLRPYFDYANGLIINDFDNSMYNKIQVPLEFQSSAECSNTKDVLSFCKRSDKYNVL